MESSGVPGRIQVSQTSYDLLHEDYLFEERGKMQIKGKGTMIAYLYQGRMMERTNSGRDVRRRHTLDLGSPALPTVASLLTVPQYNGLKEEIIENPKITVELDNLVVSDPPEKPEPVEPAFEPPHVVPNKKIASGTSPRVKSARGSPRKSNV